MERIQKTLSRAGIASRRQAEQWLAAGRIRVNGERVTRPGFKVSPTDQVEVDGRVIETSAPQRYLLLYKPRGCITTRFDPEGRPTTADFLPREGSGLFAVGRLDYGSEGLLLFTNDGDLAQHLMRPRSHVPKTYKVKVNGLPGPAALQRLRQPFRLGRRLTRPAEVRLVRANRNAILTVRLTEGHKNQVREMFWRVNHPVMRLRRIAYGPLRDEGLRPGQSRPLSSDEVDALRAAVGSWRREMALGAAG